MRSGLARLAAHCCLHKKPNSHTLPARDASLPTTMLTWYAQQLLDQHLTNGYGEFTADFDDDAVDDSSDAEEGAGGDGGTSCMDTDEETDKGEDVDLVAQETWSTMNPLRTDEMSLSIATMSSLRTTRKPAWRMIVLPTTARSTKMPMMTTLQTARATLMRAKERKDRKCGNRITSTGGCTDVLIAAARPEHLKDGRLCATRC